MLTRSLPFRMVPAYLTAAVVLASAALGVFPAAAQTATLGYYNVDPNAISVSGISSGGYMANQVHVAFSAHLIGAGIVAGGPFRCAETGAFPPVVTGTTICSAIGPFAGPPNLQETITLTDQAASSNRIDHPSNLCRSRVFLFSSVGDHTVPQPVMDTLNSFYQHYLVDNCSGQPNGGVNAIQYQRLQDPQVPHAFVTNDYGVSCYQMATEQNPIPYICNQEYDTAGATLAQIYGPLQPRVTPVPANLIEFDQSEFIQHRESAVEDSMHHLAHIYVPSSCATQTCRLHIAFHGCLQSQDTSDDAFYAHAGYNQWAESNNIIVLYPQVKAVGSDLNPINPQGCWDFWGYNGPGWWQGYDASSLDLAGPQLWAIRGMINRIAGNIIPDRLPQSSN